MPSDIRSFFGGKGATSSPAAVEGTKNVPASKPKGRGKRKVVNDSDDEPPPKKSTPQRAASKKQVKQDSPVGEVTTTSDYFASSKKGKTAASSTKPSTKVEVTPKPTSKTQAVPTPTSARSGRTSSRKKAKPDYTDPAEDDDDAPIAEAASDSDPDIFGADYKISGGKAQDDYESDPDEQEEDVRAVRKRGKKIAQVPLVDEDDTALGLKDVSMKDAELEEELANPNVKEKPKASRSANITKVTKGRKRKSAELEEEDGEHEPNTSSNRTSPVKKPASKKARTPKKKEEVLESKEMQDIFDRIPLIRPPTPPQRDVDKKFDHRIVANNSQSAPAAGSKDIPTGADNCLAGLTFVFTGLLDALSRDDGTALVKRYGGKVTTAPSSRTSYVVLGNDAGPKKLETIKKFKIKVINEDGLFALIKSLPPNGGDSKAAAAFEKKQDIENKKVREMAEEMESEEQNQNGTGRRPATATKSAGATTSSPVDTRLWTVKYAPTSTQHICGNKLQVERLQTWLRNWRNNFKTKFKKAGPDGTGSYRAIIISGAPGIGKTTAAHLAAKLEGYDIFESNASDTRSKKLVETGLKGVWDTTSLLGYFAGDGKQVDAEKKKLVLIMDEVDGMSAGDRGGVGALASVCKKTNIPMILICNERRLPKMKPFDHVTFDLPFKKPTTDNVRGRIMTILHREGMRDLIPTTVVNALIEGCRADIRQIINMISTIKVDQQAVNFDSGKKMSSAWEKHVILKPWDIVNKILGGGLFSQSSKVTLNEKIELYFNDHEMSSLMLHENYLGTTPVLAGAYSGREKNLKLLELSDKAAESISDGDLVDRMIHGSQQQWSLMPTHAVFSFVRPASFVFGSLGYHGQTRFPAWMGKNSVQGKLTRFIKEIQGHMRLRTSGDRHEIRQQYLPLLWYRLVDELQKNGREQIEDMIKLMDVYYLTKEDWDAILELGVGPMSMDHVKLDAQTKSAFTRTYNQLSHPLPFMKASNVVAPKKSDKERPDLEEAIDDSDDAEELPEAEGGGDEEEELDLKKDKYVRAPKKKPPPKKAAAKGKGKDKVKGEDDEKRASEISESEEDVNPQKGRGKAIKAAAGKGRGRPKKV